MNILAGDIGGTKARLQLCNARGQTRVIVTRSYSSQAYDGLVPIVTEFLTETARNTAPPIAACFAVAGPVRDQRAKITNLPWMVDATHLATQLGIQRVFLINDIQGIGYGICGLDAKELEVLQVGAPESSGTRVIMAAGTGLGQGAMIRHKGDYAMLATEGGHADFAPRDELELDLLRYLLARLGQVSYETLLSGRGLMRIYEFLRDTGRAIEPAWIAAALHNADDPAAVISSTALAADAPAIAKLTLARFVRIYGAQAGNLALTFFATGGVYVAGGIVFNIAQAMRSGAFINAFRRNAAMSSLLERVPVSIVRTPEIGLYGARCVALRLTQSPGDVYGAVDL
jgi:glucokinase